jgi:hypothetical protein
MIENHDNANDFSDRSKVIDKLLDYDLKSYVTLLSIGTDTIRVLSELTKEQQVKLATVLAEQIGTQEYFTRIYRE